jgi:hypothetical protein
VADEITAEAAKQILRQQLVSCTLIMPTDSAWPDQVFNNRILLEQMGAVVDPRLHNQQVGFRGRQ